MSVSTLSSKNRICLPADIVQAARLRMNDEIAWTVDPTGQILGRKLTPAQAPSGKLVQDSKTGFFFWSASITGDAAEDAALNANLLRDE